MQLKNLSTEAYDELAQNVLADKEEGLTSLQLQEKYELNHSQVDLIVYTLRATDDVVEAYMNSGASMGERTVAGRKDAHSWGFMAVLETIGTGRKVSESAIRNAFKATSDTKSEGQRIGRGGRFYMVEPTLYQDELKPTGTVIPADAPRSREVAVTHANEQRFTRLSMEGQNHIGEQVNLPYVKGMSRAKWMNAVIAVMVGRVPMPSKASTPEEVLSGTAPVSKPARAKRPARTPKAKSPAATTVVEQAEEGESEGEQGEQGEEGAA